MGGDYDQQEIMEKLEGLSEELRDVRDELTRKIKEFFFCFQTFLFGVFMLAVIVGNGISLSKAIWIALAWAFIWYVYNVFRHGKYAHKRTRE